MAKWAGNSAKAERASKGDYERDRSSRGQLSQLFLRDLLADWKEHGRSAISAARLQKPEQYLRIIATTIPKEMLVGPSDSMTALLTKVNSRAKEAKKKALPLIVNAEVVRLRPPGGEGQVHAAKVSPATSEGSGNAS